MDVEALELAARLEAGGIAAHWDCFDTARMLRSLSARLVAAEQERDRLKSVLLDWRATPGNVRTGAWWHRWHASFDAALSRAEAPPCE